ncbi:MAG: ribonucleoside-diphosphate reductase, adenosylcobalamin-dependent [SAR324 cluster bacterium]|uniref:Vitamin B12-dependent ribonucleotide reductase n=1 Tax=SAR324 cluster bacterium TaxID=2024889 RepID=A0A2A4TBS3_9DELT|nr:MAG: ribonucleoside-diphosphate reductase, adenosylcobalamin-dependent [SAR324 cluster bacterium]
MSNKKTGLKFTPYFYQQTDAAPTVWETIEWENRDSAITAADGSKIFEMKDVEIPKGWSQLATDIVASKYFRKAGVPNKRGHEYSVKELVHRVAHSLATQGKAMEYFATDQDAINFENDLKWLLVHQHGAFNSPVWFNVGLFAEYGITGSGENFAWDGKDDFKEIENQYERPQGSACFIQSVDDDLSSIFELVKNEARLFKYGSGTGSNMSHLRGSSEKLSGGGQSSGLLSFLKVLDSAAGAIKSGGTTRRAAVMRCLDIDHPEIEEFINWKAKEEAKAKALIAKGYSSDFNGEAYATVSGQNSNNSVRLTDKFMQQLEKDGDWQTINRTDGKVNKTLKAKDLFNQISTAAWSCADPGVQFDTIINDWHTCSNSAPIRSSNPCSEYMFVDDSACNLSSLNLLKFYKDGEFDIQRFKKACRIFLLAQEILVDFGSYPTKRITKNSHEFRPLGIGYANLGTLLMMAGHAYDSVDGRAMAGLITAIMTGHSYEVSTEMAQCKGTFKRYKENQEVMLNVMKMHQAALLKDAYKTNGDAQLEALAKAAKQCWEGVLQSGTKYGFRNAQVSVLAPTGTIGLLMDCATTGIEPAFSLVMWKKLAGGGIIPMVNQSVPAVLAKLGYSPVAVKEIAEYVKTKGTIERAPGLKDEHLSIFDCAMAGGNGVRSIKPMGHAKMMAAAQPFLSGAISKTINMPANSTVEDIEAVYLESWKLGLKAIAIYRDGSKGSQPLNTTLDDEQTEQLETIEFLRNEIDKLQKAVEKKDHTINLDWGKAKKLPDYRNGKTWEIKVAGTKIFLRSGENTDGSLGEIFVDLGYKEGSTVRALMNQFAISISFSLQHGVPLEKLVQRFSFTKFEPHGRVSGHPYLKSATSLIDAIFRVLGHHYLGRTDFLQIKPAEHTVEEIKPLAPVTPEAQKPKKYDNPETTHDHMPCGDCGSTEFLRTGTCYVCITCGASQGCS